MDNDLLRRVYTDDAITVGKVDSIVQQDLLEVDDMPEVPTHYYAASRHRSDSNMEGVGTRLLTDDACSQIGPLQILRKEGVALRVVDEENGYVTIEMHEGNREIRQAIDKGHDSLTTQFEHQWTWDGTSESQRSGALT